MSILQTNFRVQALTKLEETLIGLGGVLPSSPAWVNFEQRVLELTNAIALRLGATVSAAADPGTYHERSLQLLAAIAQALGGAVVIFPPSNYYLQVLSRLGQILLGLGGVIPDAVEPGNDEERLLQLLGAIAMRSSSWNSTAIN